MSEIWFLFLLTRYLRQTNTQFKHFFVCDRLFPRHAKISHNLSHCEGFFQRKCVHLNYCILRYLAVNTYFTYLLFQRNLYINPTHIALILLTSFVLKFSSYSNANSILLQGELNQNELDFILHGRIYKTRVFSVHLHIV